MFSSQRSDLNSDEIIVKKYAKFRPDCFKGSCMDQTRSNEDLIFMAKYSRSNITCEYTTINIHY